MPRAELASKGRSRMVRLQLRSSLALLLGLSLAAGCRNGAGSEDRTEVLLASGDIADCASSGDEATAALLDGLPGTIATLGDNAYPDGSAASFSQCYAPTWGRHLARTHPSPGNHEYITPGASAYFTYFGAAAGTPGEGWYGYDLGAWHLIALNSEVPHDPASPQLQWLRAELQAHRGSCTLAYWHRPRFSSSEHGSAPDLTPFWDALYAAGADLVLVGHDHVYERFAPQAPDGSADLARGIRQFTVGTGGRSLYTFPTVAPNSQLRYNQGFGVLRLELSRKAYRWRFIPTAGVSPDSGSASCH
jgi:hypothetical protein